jgi:hypothetical protein
MPAHLRPEFSQIDSALEENHTAAMQLALAGGNEVEQADRAIVDVRRCMNAMKTVATALKCVESLNLTESGEQAKAFHGLLQGAAHAARAILARLGHDPDDRNNRWMLNMIERQLIGSVGPTGLVDQNVADQVAAAVMERIDDDPIRNQTVYDRSEIVDLAIFRGLALLRRAQEEFDFGRAKFAGSDLATARDLAIQSALHLMGEFTPELLPAADRATFLALLLDQTFLTLEAAWRIQAARAREAQTGASEAQLNAWRAANPNGFPLDPVWTQFERTLARLARLTSEARKARK